MSTSSPAIDGASTRLSVGAEWKRGVGVEFRVWAPDHASVQLVLDQRERLSMQRAGAGYWTLCVASARPGTLYQYAFENEPDCYPDPASRFQPQGTHGPSEVIDPAAFAWQDAAWRGVPAHAQVIYELHVGTFTTAGTWDAARSQLPHLQSLGITTIELMPVNAFPGTFGWGYDGVGLFAPHDTYGRPDDFRAFVDAAHAHSLAVILDVVYNHFGPSDNHFERFSPYYYAKRETEWGTALNFDGEQARPVRDFVCENAEYWVREFHLDGLRLDATQSIYDSSAEHVLRELARRARVAAGERTIWLVAENEPQNSDLVRPASADGYGLDALWNDDFHHSALVNLTGHSEAYYRDYLGRAQEFVAAAKYGYLYQGQYYGWQKQPRGTPCLDLPARAFVTFLENHDQVANSASGARLAQCTQPGAHRAMTALLLLGPWTPMLFQGQEWSSPAPFQYFADHGGELARAVAKGRRESLSQFPSLASRATQENLPDPCARSTFDACKLDWSALAHTPASERSLHWHRALLQLRREDPVLNSAIASARFDAAALNERCLLLRYFSPHGDDRLLIVNLGPQLAFRPAPEPLLAPPRHARWSLQLSSEEPRYGGSGVPEAAVDEAGWEIAGYAANLFRRARE
jgi:maltooligosyltrehalose trehalohydrolase